MRVLAAWGVAMLIEAAPTAGSILRTDQVGFDGLGAVKIGMTPEQAEMAAGISLELNNNAGSGDCFSAQPDRPSRGISFLGTGGVIARADVHGNSRIATPEGIRIGAAERAVKRAYPGRIKVERHTYVRRGHYLIARSSDPALSDRRIVFETDGRRVTSIRAGRMPEVEYVEGCA
ncbi:MAG: hypothetical protein H0T15_00110 [Thermoleophilaceae bacterium]|nr:hypothetical protein [Thermoleophilaceae bacterium]